MMKKTKQIFKMLRLAILLLTAVGILSACSGNPSSEPTAPAQEKSYTVQVVSASGQALENVTVFVYADATQSDLIAAARTDATGSMTFTAPSAEGYTAILKDVPAGYVTMDRYPVSNAMTRLVLETQLISDPEPGDTFGLNDVMFDFTVTDTQNNQYTLSRLLQGKKAVVLNFWYANCDPCKAEFPYLQEAYLQYRDDIALLAINPMDSVQIVEQFGQTQGLSIPLVGGDSSVAGLLGISNYPTTVIIDCYGTINLIHSGGVDETEVFAKLFAYYAAEDYTQQMGLTITDFLSAP